MFRETAFVPTFTTTFSTFNEVKLHFKQVLSYWKTIIVDLLVHLTTKTFSTVTVIHQSIIPKLSQAVNAHL